MFYFFSLLFESERTELIVLGRVIDGDTFESKDGRTFRLANINAPEKNTPGAGLSKAFLEEFQNQTLEIENLGADKYDRHLARVYSQEYINLKLVSEGLASKFLVDSSELQVFARAEREAVQEGKGIWTHSPHLGCIKSNINEKEEVIRLINKCNISTARWYLKDESRKIYYFNATFLDIRLHSGKGKENVTDLFWQNSAGVWNNDRDSAYIFDEEGRIVHYDSYGY